MKDGSETESVDVMHYLWNDNWPANKCPKLREFTLDGKSAYDNIFLKAGQTYEASVQIEEPEADSIEYVWDVKPESTDLGDGGDFESTPESIPGLMESTGANASFTAPEKSGAYRLFIYAKDGKGHTAHANIPFYVND
jgi:hypothetical protein